MKKQKIKKSAEDKSAKRERERDEGADKTSKLFKALNLITDEIKEYKLIKKRKKQLWKIVKLKQKCLDNLFRNSEKIKKKSL